MDEALADAELVTSEVPDRAAMLHTMSPAATGVERIACVPRHDQSSVPLFASSRRERPHGKRVKRLQIAAKIIDLIYKGGGGSASSSRWHLRRPGHSNKGESRENT